VEEYGRTRQAMEDNIIWHMRCACWIAKATDTLRICNWFSMATVVLRMFRNVTFICTLPVLAFIVPDILFKFTANHNFVM